jgi:hypothetical protein
LRIKDGVREARVDGEAQVRLDERGRDRGGGERGAYGRGLAACARAARAARARARAAARARACAQLLQPLPAVLGQPPRQQLRRQHHVRAAARRGHAVDEGGKGAGRVVVGERVGVGGRGRGRQPQPRGARSYLQVRADGGALQRAEDGARLRGGHARGQRGQVC